MSFDRSIFRGLYLFDRVYVVFTIIFGATTDALESCKAWRRCSVSVNVDDFTAFDVLEKPHCCVASIVLHHLGVLLALANIESWVLENAALAISALGRVLKEVLAY